jgi:hypothetical protein
VARSGVAALAGNGAASGAHATATNSLNVNRE